MSMLKHRNRRIAMRRLSLSMQNATLPWRGSSNAWWAGLPRKNGQTRPVDLFFDRVRSRDSPFQYREQISRLWDDIRCRSQATTSFRILLCAPSEASAALFLKAPLGIRYSFGRKRGDDVLSNFDASRILGHAENGKKKVSKRRLYETYI